MASATAAAGTAQAVLPISEISTYHRTWTIRARVTSKSDIRTFSKGANEGKVFSVDLLDAEGGEIRASFFQPAVDKFFPILEKGKCFTFSRGNVKVANKQFNLSKHRYELVFDERAVVEAAADDTNIQTIKVSVTDLKSVQAMALPCVVDLCGVVTSFKPLVSFTSKDGKELVKRDLTLADDSGLSIDITLWSERAKVEEKCLEGNPVIAIKGVSIKEYQGGRQGSILPAGAVVLAPENQEAKTLQKWWTEGGSSQTLTTLSAISGSGGGGFARQGRPADLAQLRQAFEGTISEQPEIYTVVGRLALVQTRKQGETQPLYYDACQEPKQNNGLPCNKRVDEGGFCASCNRSGKVVQKFNLRCKFADYGDSLWVTTFHEGASKVVNMSAENAKALEKGDGGREALEESIRGRYFSEPLQLTMRVKLDTYMGEKRPNVSCVDARPVPFGEHGRKLLKEIQDMLALESSTS